MEKKSLHIFLYSGEVIEQKLDYIHNNPVIGKWNLVQDLSGYKYSSNRFYEKEDSAYDFVSNYMEMYE
ncbi:MAG: hypothetical protein M3512_02525 [Bacteroidota bacterium]|nr:hypothetical protein [Bacteroidota bacterium]